MSGNTRYLGLSVPEWTIILAIAAIFLVLFSVPITWVLVFGIPLVMTYALVLSKMEENILFVFRSARRIPNIVYGSFRKPLPFQKMRSTNDLDG